MSARKNIKRKIDDVDDDDDDKMSEENAHSRLSLNADDTNEDIQIITEESTISLEVEDLNSDIEIITEDSRTSLDDDDIQIVFEGSCSVSNDSAGAKKLPNLPMNRKECNKNNDFKIGTSKDTNKFHEHSKTISNRCNENEYGHTKTCTNSRKRSLLECKNQEKHEIVIDVETDSEIHINESLRSDVDSSFRNRENYESCRNLKQPDNTDEMKALHSDVNFLEHVETDIEFEKSLVSNKFSETSIVSFEPKLNVSPTVFSNNNVHNSDISKEELKKILETVKNVYVSSKSSQNVKECVDNITKQLLNADINSIKHTEKEIQNDAEKKSLYTNDYNLSCEKALELVKKRHENNENCQNLKPSCSTDAKGALHFDENSLENVEIDVEFEKSLDDKKSAESDKVLLEPKLNTLPTKNYISEATMIQTFCGKRRSSNRGHFLTKMESIKPKKTKTPEMKSFENNTPLTVTLEDLHSLIKTPDINIDLSRLYSHENKPKYRESSSALSTNCMPSAVARLNHTSLNNHQIAQNVKNQCTDWALQNPLRIQSVFPIRDPRIPPPYYSTSHIPPAISVQNGSVFSAHPV